MTWCPGRICAETCKYPLCNPSQAALTSTASPAPATLAARRGHAHPPRRAPWRGCTATSPGRLAARLAARLVRPPLHGCLLPRAARRRRLAGHPPGPPRRQRITAGLARMPQAGVAAPCPTTQAHHARCWTTPPAAGHAGGGPGRAAPVQGAPHVGICAFPAAGLSECRPAVTAPPLLQSHGAVGKWGRKHSWRLSLWPGGRVSRSLRRARHVSHPCGLHANACQSALVLAMRQPSRRGWGAHVCLALAYQRIRAAGRSRQTRMLQPRSFSKHASDPAADLACVHALRITVSRAGVRPWGRPATPTQQRTAIVAPKGSAACLLAAG